MFALPDLPYGFDALAPVISAETLRTHHGKHHKAYVEKTNALASQAGLAGRPLEDVVREARRRGDTKLFNNAAQAWNHAFFWQSMTPGGARAAGALSEAIRRAFGGEDQLKDLFVEEGAGHFASGWVWLVAGSEGLAVISTHDADDTLVRDGVFPLLVCDLWEHAYYLDHKNDRKGFLAAWFDRVADFGFAERQLAASEGRGEGFRYASPRSEAPESAEQPAPGPTV